MAARPSAEQHDEPAAPHVDAAYRTLKLPRKHLYVLGRPDCSESERQVPVPLGGRDLPQSKTQRSTASDFRRTDASAPPAESLPAPKNFFAKASFTQRLPPLWDRTIFGQVFVRGGMTEFSKWKVPLPGGQARRNKLLVSWGPSLLQPSERGVFCTVQTHTSACHALLNLGWMTQNA